MTDRVVELRRVRAGDLVPHPKNWRQHGDEQLKALDAVLESIGIADVILAFPADGKGAKGNFDRLMIFDGHARTERDAEQVWPILVTDLTRKEADKMLASLDPIAAMADTDSEMLDELLSTFKSLDDATASLFDDIRRNVAMIPDPDTSEPNNTGDGPKEVDPDGFELEHKCPRCGFEFNDDAE